MLSIRKYRKRDATNGNKISSNARFREKRRSSRRRKEKSKERENERKGASEVTEVTETGTTAAMEIVVGIETMQTENEREILNAITTATEKRLVWMKQARVKAETESAKTANLAIENVSGSGKETVKDVRKNVNANVRRSAKEKKRENVNAKRKEKEKEQEKRNGAEEEKNVVERERAQHLAPLRLLDLLARNLALARDPEREIVLDLLHRVVHLALALDLHLLLVLDLVLAPALALAPRRDQGLDRKLYR